MRSIHSFCDRDYTFFNAYDNFIVTPASVYKKRIWYKIIEFENLDFSVNITPEGWIQIADVIEK